MALNNGCPYMSENKVDISWLFKPYKPRMYMSPKKNFTSILSAGLAYAFSEYFSAYGSCQIFWFVHVKMYSIRSPVIKSWKHSNCAFASLVKLVTAGLFLGQSNYFCLPETALG